MGKLGSFSNYLGRQRVSGHTNLRQKELRHYSKNKSAVVELVETDKVKKRKKTIPAVHCVHCVQEKNEANNDNVKVLLLRFCTVNRRAGFCFDNL